MICVYNNCKQMEDMLLKSCNKALSEGGGNFLLIDNQKGKYASCAEAYNKELKSRWNDLGDVLIFLHQDIAFDDDSFICRIEQELKTNPQQILGFAGMPRAGRTVSNLRYFSTKQFITCTQIKEKTEVESVDECCFAMTKNLYFKILFDEKTCSHWHLYAVDFCYQAKREFNISSYVLPESIYHKMDGSSGLSTDRHFLWTMFKMTRKYRNRFSTMYAPCYIVSTSLPKAMLKIGKTMLRNMLG